MNNLKWTVHYLQFEKKVKTKKCDITKDDDPLIEFTEKIETNEREDTDSIIAKMDELKYKYEI